MTPMAQRSLRVSIASTLIGVCIAVLLPTNRVTAASPVVHPGVLIQQVPDAESFGRHLRVLTEAPHPTGSPRNMELADYVRDRFVEVKVARGSRPPPPIAIDLSTGVRVQVPVGFEETHLRRVISALSSC